MPLLRARPAVPALMLSLLSLACFELPASFRDVSLEEARRLAVDPDVSVVVVSAYGDEDQPGALRWDADEVRSGKLPALPAGTVLVVASDAFSAHRAAALLVRAGNGPIRVFVAESREERSHLFAAATAEEEVRGEDS